MFTSGKDTFLQATCLDLCRPIRKRDESAPHPLRILDLDNEGGLPSGLVAKLVKNHQTMVHC